MKMKLLETENRNTLLVFALGEFVLIIIGILIALQIDNWNENRKERKLEMKYLLALQDEFRDNLAKLERVMSLNNRNANRALELSKFTGPQVPEITEEKFDSLAMFGNSEIQYRPGTGVLDDIISSGKLELISNDQLRFEITSWQSIIQSVRFQEQEHARFRYNIIDIVLAEGNNRILQYNIIGERFGISPSKFPDGNLSMLNSIEFDNQLVAFIGTAIYLNENYYARLANKINTVLSLLEGEINK